jgi:crotonobetainyl-CoA:carnitine CoA-transferase CaiB-like acyl-CoA transferase
MLVEVEHPVFGRLLEVGSAIKTAGVVLSPEPAPRLGEHTDHYLAAVLGYGARTIATLRERGAIL